MRALNEFINERSLEGKYTTSEIKAEVSKVYDEISFRKFGNAFRKHVDPHFSKEMNQEALRGMSWGELASYIIGDGDFTIDEVQFRNFMNAVGKKTNK